MKNVILKHKHDRKYKDGYLVLEEADILEQDAINEGERFVLKSHEGDVLGLFYYGKQNRGAGFKIGSDLDVRLETSYFKQLFEAAKNERESLYNAEHTNAFRVYNGEGDGLGGFTVDNYDGHFLIQWYSKGIYQYKDEVVESLREVFQYTTLHEKLRFDHNVPTHRVSEENVEFPIIIKENNLFYTIHFEDGPMTGIFLDQRDVRSKIMTLPLEEGQSMLNLFAYSGGFSVAAAKNGMETVSVDIAKRSLELIEQNFALNEINIDQQLLYTMDVFDMMKYCKRKRMRFDLIVIDPPSFSRAKKKRFSVKDNYDELIEGALSILNQNGYMVLSTNASNFTLAQFKKMINETLEGRRYEITDVMGLPKDFKTTSHYKPSKYLKVVFVKILD
ncbi:class I SAM-dependent rRNA methyltransferase [Macrococcus hajekii]|uniref:Class I SAM-dependent rRNA methyltransferase n=1 Tax=Macrococcus hajekii TaxID=198482 RepID=A0A4R6BNG5_9STAP|nr:class I SAM-dependent rRNA methyltransferase [Macrococcus hajekii]TDM03341.1 class I SAM-dependent rRNA methyltransferase [Macrococcus hajekii]GGA98024.1 SAM-dependent methyltransferase [Macrococcus hajekii]